MLAILISWMLIFFVFVSFGNMFTAIYNRVCSREQHFSLIDTYVFGMCFATIIVSITSLWLPSDHYILFAFVAASLLYWMVNRRKTSSFLKHIQSEWNSLSATEKVLVILSILSILWLSIRAYERYGDTIYDSLYYHQANIAWNEAYRVIPGLANIEERFGFNSNYLLISAPFTLRFLFGDAIYGICSLTVAVMLVWTVILVFKSNYGLKEICAFILFFFVVILNRNDLNITSTDLLPSLLIILLSIKILLYTTDNSRNMLMFALLPVYIMTLKMSCALILLSSLIVFFVLMRKKQYKIILFVVVASVLIVVPWLVRNVMVSGYLVYPLAAIDLFAVDWKVPVEIMQKELEYITFHAKVEYLHNLTTEFEENNKASKYYWHVIVFFVSVAFTILALAGIVVKRKKIQTSHKFVLFIIGANVLYLVLQAPSFRFGMGYIYAIMLFACCIWIGRNNICLKGYSLDFGYGSRSFSVRNLAILIIVAFIGYLSVNSVRNINRTKRHLVSENKMEKNDALRHIFYKPITTSDRIKMVNKDARYRSWPEAGFIPYPLSDSVSVYVSVDRQSYLYDMPLTVPDYHVEGIHFKSIFQDHHDLELRGNRVEDGFRTRFENRDNLKKKTPVLTPET